MHLDYGHLEYAQEVSGCTGSRTAYRSIVRGEKKVRANYWLEGCDIQSHGFCMCCIIFWSLYCTRCRQCSTVLHTHATLHIYHMFILYPYFMIYDYILISNFTGHWAMSCGTGLHTSQPLPAGFWWRFQAFVQGDRFSQ